MAIYQEFLNYVKVPIKENDLSPTLILDRELNLSDIGEPLE